MNLHIRTAGHRSLRHVGAVLFACLQGCSVLVGNSFDGYTAADAGDNAKAHLPSSTGKDAGVDGAEPPTEKPPAQMMDAAAAIKQRESGTKDAGSAAPPTTIGGNGSPAANSEADAGEDNPITDDAILLPPRAPCQGTPVREFPFDPPIDLSRWIVRTDSPEAVSGLTKDDTDGSPKPGALSATATFTDSTQSVKVETILESVLPTTCLSARLKVIEDPGNPDLSNTKAGWYIFAVDANGCYAQSEIGRSPWWRYDITQAGVWYEVTANTAQLTNGPMCTHFAPDRVQKIGLGIATSSSHVWHARFAIDTIRVY